MYVTNSSTKNDLLYSWSIEDKPGLSKIGIVKMRFVQS